MLLSVKSATLPWYSPDILDTVTVIKRSYKRSSREGILSMSFQIVWPWNACTSDPTVGGMQKKCSPTFVFVRCSAIWRHLDYISNLSRSIVCPQWIYLRLWYTTCTYRWRRQDWGVWISVTASWAGTYIVFFRKLFQGTAFVSRVHEK